VTEVGTAGTGRQTGLRVEQPVLVRQAIATDVAAIACLKAAFAREEDVLHVLEASEDDWQRDLFSPVAHFTALMAESGGEAVGILIYAEKFYPGWNGVTLVIHDLYVLPEWRRRRIATTLLSQLAAHAVSHNIPIMELNVREDNPARAFYSRAGFQHLPQCLTYLIALPALQDLAAAAGELAGLL
jgi:ribosomal protein S18 acetylase RimI-like enzyme